MKKASTGVSGTTSSNKLTIRTKKKIAAKNKTVIVTAKIYNKNGKLQTTLKTKTGKIKVKPTKIEVLASDWDGKTFLVNDTYQMRYKITPANATSTNTWSVTDASGNRLITLQQQAYLRQRRMVILSLPFRQRSVLKSLHPIA